MIRTHRLGAYLFVSGILAFSGFRSLIWGPLFGKIGGGFGLVLAAVGLGIVVSEVVVSRAERRPNAQTWEPAFNNGIALARDGRWDEAMPQFSSAIQASGAPLSRMRAAERIGDFLIENKKPADAIPYLHDALSLRMRYAAAQPATIAITASKLAEALYLQGDPAGARAASGTALAAIEKANPSSPDLVAAWVGAAKFATRTGEYERAEALLNRAMDRANRSGSIRAIQFVRSTLVDMYTAAGRYADAVKVGQENLNQMETSEPVVTARLHRQHADLLDLANRPDDAAKHRRVAQTLELMAGAQQQP
jgi:tetratricopeptide (TPR) repeat protein